MKIIDAYILARTKRKTRRIRMALVTLVSALLFAVLFFGSFVATGVMDSAAQFKDVGYNGRYLSVAFKNGPSFGDPASADQTIRAQMDTELRARNVKVDDVLRQGAEYQGELSFRMGEFFTKEAQKSQTDMEQEVTDRFHPKSIYHFTLLGSLRGSALKTADNPDPYLKQIQSGEGSSAYKQLPPESEGSAEFYHVEADMLKPLLQPGSTLDWQPGQPYPALVPYAYVAKVAGKSFAGLGSQAKIDGYAQLVKEYLGKELTYCYRNSTAQQQVLSVVNYNKQAEADKDPKTTPITVGTCQGFDQAQLKKAGIVEAPNPDAPKPLFPARAGPAPVTREVTIKIAGFVPTRDYSPNESILRSTFSEVNGWPAEEPLIIPSEVVAADTLLQSPAEAEFQPTPQIFIDFATRTEQKAFLDSGCIAEQCMNAATLIIFPFGSIKVALESTFNGIMTAAKWVVIAVAVIAALLTLLTISKIIADSRREIAVFRALGARRRDIAQIYFTYGFMLAGSSLVVALILAAAGALVLSAYFSAGVNAVMVEAVGAYTMASDTSLFGINWPWLGGITVVLFMASFIGILIPVLLSNRKDLMDVMRDE